MIFKEHTPISSARTLFALIGLSVTLSLLNKDVRDHISHILRGDFSENVPAAEADKNGQEMFYYYESAQAHLNSAISLMVQKIDTSDNGWGDFSEIEFVEAITNLFSDDPELQTYIMQGAIIVHREMFEDIKGYKKIRITFRVPFRKEDPKVIEFYPPQLVEIR